MVILLMSSPQIGWRAFRNVLAKSYLAQNTHLTQKLLIDLAGLQTLSDRHLQVCSKFAVDSTHCGRDSDKFPLNSKTHGTTLKKGPSNPEPCVIVGAQLYHISL